MNILEKIIANKRVELQKNMTEIPVSSLRDQPNYGRKTISLKESLGDTGKTGIIAEFKRMSPSKGVIHATADVAQVTKAYTEHHAAGLSILTDISFFGGSGADLITARQHDIPILRKDFIIDEYQIEEAKALGADVILLIAACLTTERTRELAVYAKQLEMEVLLEIHNEEELGHISEETELVGINNRDLRTFTVDIDRSIQLGRQVPDNKTRIAESGIHSAAMVHLLRDAGFGGFLMGEKFMQEQDPGEAFRLFVKQLKINYNEH